jgi:hypothetical protein
MPTNQVMALFGDSALSFTLANGATFADLADRLDHLADRLDHLGEQHIGMPKAIYLKFHTARQPISVTRAGI